MKLELPQQDQTDIESGNYHVEITQEDSNGELATIYIAKDNAERFCAMVMECARAMLKGEVVK